MYTLQSYHQVSVAEELKKNPDLKNEDLKQLREWNAVQTHLPAITDEMLIIFHHSCFYDLEDTKTCIQKYYSMRHGAPEFFDNRVITSTELAFSAKVLGFAVLPRPDADGNYIFYQRLLDYSPSKCVYDDQIKLLNMTIDALSLRLGTVPGYVIVVDLYGTTMRHVPRFGYTQSRKSSQYMTEANPIRLKGIHLTNVYWWIPRAFEVFKTFLNKSVTDKMHFHATNTTLYDYVPRRCLPQEAGGDLYSIEHYHAENLKNLESLQDYFLEEQTVRHDANKTREEDN